MGCNVINFSSRINEEIKLKNKKIFIRVYKTWMRYAAWFAETWCIMKRLENMCLLIIKSNTAMRNWYVHFVVGCRIIETIVYRNHTIRFWSGWGESWVWYTILLRHGKNTYHPREYDGEIVFAGRTAFCNRSNGRKRQISLKWLGQGWWGSFNNGYVLLGYPEQVTK